MAWIYLAESVDSPSPWRALLGRSPIVKTIDTLKLSCFPECQTDLCQWLLYGTTSKRSMPMSCKFLWTLFTEGSLARISALQDAKKAWLESEADFFSRSYGSFARYDHSSSSWKMSQELLPFLEPLQELWPRSGMIVAGECYPLMTWERRTIERDGSVLPTPTAQEGGYNQSSPTSKKRPTLTTMASKNLWPTPVVHGNYNRRGASKTSGNGLATVVKMFPTPRASEATRAGQAEGNRKSPGITWVATNGQPGKLNPQWVEWLMGYNIDHTALEDWAMQWFQSKRAKRLKDLLVSKQPPQENEK